MACLKTALSYTNRTNLSEQGNETAGIVEAYAKVLLTQLWQIWALCIAK